MDPEAYHLLELETARHPDDERRITPPLAAGDQRILDLGCGAGQTLIASPLAPGVLACGVDVDLGALALGRRLTDAVQFVCARGESLPFHDGSFDLVISRVAVPYMNIPAALAQISGVLRKQGRIWLVLHPVSIPLRQMAKNLARGQPKAVVWALYVLANGVLLHLIGKQVAFPFGRIRYESFQTIRGITRALQRAGFEQVAVRYDRFFVVTGRKAAD